MNETLEAGSNAADAVIWGVVQMVYSAEQQFISHHFIQPSTWASSHSTEATCLHQFNGGGGRKNLAYKDLPK